MTNRQIERRFNALVIRQATGTATAADLAKLDRYQRLRRNRRPKPPANERMFWDGRMSIRFMECLGREYRRQQFTYPRSKSARNWLNLHGLRVTEKGVEKAIAVVHPSPSEAF